MADPISSLPASKAFADDERSVLLGYLAYHRAVLARKLDGLTDAQARLAAIAPSRLTLLGLVRHMTDVERWWFRRVLIADDVPALYADEEEWDIPPDAIVSSALAAFWDEIAVIDGHLAMAGMDDMSTGNPDAGRHALRRTIVHMIEEYARHCGHADLLREVIDGSSGD
ncbi:MAG: DinB family protein [Actinomycetota bacterium]